MSGWRGPVVHLNWPLSLKLMCGKNERQVPIATRFFTKFHETPYEQRCKHCSREYDELLRNKARWQGFARDLFNLTVKIAPNTSAIVVDREQV